MLQAVLRRAAPSLLRQGGALSTSAVRQLATEAAKKPEDDEVYELLPPGCSLADPTHGRSFGRNRNSMSDPVLMYDTKPVEEYQPLKKRQPLPSPPLNVEAAQAKLQESKDAKKRAQAEQEDDELYVYLPPGSSMRDPLPSSLSDPLDNRKVYYRDPIPTTKKK